MARLCGLLRTKRILALVEWVFKCILVTSMFIPGRCVCHLRYEDYFSKPPFSFAGNTSSLDSSSIAPAAVVLRSYCTQNLLESQHNILVWPWPPSHSILFFSSSSLELPDSCCYDAVPLNPLQKIIPAFWDYVEYAKSHNLANCHPIFSPTCSSVHSASGLVAFEIHTHLWSGRSEPHNLRAKVATEAEPIWRELLAELIHPDSVLTAEDGLVVAYVHPQHLRDAAMLLAREPIVAFITPRSHRLLHNLNTVSVMLQSNDAPHVVSAHPDFVFFNDGLNGTGEVMGVGDTGVDMQHCAFHDPQVPFEGFEIGFGDGSDEENGHGTHVAAIAAGSAIFRADQTGVAPAAKLAVFDIGTAQAVTIPYNLEHDYFGVLHKAEARVQVAAWGSNALHYDSDCVAVDSFANKHPSSLPVFSAGNFGEYWDSYNTTVNSPALAKNALAVGNVLPENAAGLVSKAAADSHELSFLVNNRVLLESFVVVSEFSIDWSPLGMFPVPLSLANPIHACEGVSGVAEGDVVLVSRGQCSLEVKVEKAVNAGARAVLIGNTGDAYTVLPTQGGSTPVGFIPLSALQLLETLATSGLHIAVKYVRKIDMNSIPSEESMDSSSSQGPTLDGRVKPDLVATGTIAAAKSGTPCGVSAKTGTSMSAPVAAGAAAIVRQYFQDGCKVGTGVKHNPSGVLVKAVLIGGAQPLQGLGRDGLPMGVPSPAQGWGRVSLAGSLPLAGGATVSNLQVIDQAEVSAQYQPHVFCIDAVGGPLTVTLAWSDPAASPAAPIQLVNDLDLTVQVASLGGLKLFSRGARTPDRVNNVERVSLPNVPPGKVAISVTNFSQTTATKYSLAVQGSFSGAPSPL